MSFCGYLMDYSLNTYQEKLYRKMKYIFYVQNMFAYVLRFSIQLNKNCYLMHTFRNLFVQQSILVFCFRKSHEDSYQLNEVSSILTLEAYTYEYININKKT
jgi:hypothetical protein